MKFIIYSIWELIPIFVVSEYNVYFYRYIYKYFRELLIIFLYILDKLRIYILSHLTLTKYAYVESVKKTTTRKYQVPSWRRLM